jgi:acyl-CoA thioester hydrolase
MLSELLKFKHKSIIQVRFKDIDIMGHVNNANHFAYFELARMQYFNEVVSESINWEEEGIILAHMEIDYKKPILLHDHVLVYARVSKLGTKSFDFEYCIVVENDNAIDIVATGKSVQVCFNYLSNQTIPVPELWRAKVVAYESALT